MVAYEIKFAESVRRQLRNLKARQRAIVLQAIEVQLTHEPLYPTRHRKPLRPNPIAPWELRVGDLRVFYDAHPEEENVILVLAIGEKHGHQLLVAGKEIHL